MFLSITITKPINKMTKYAEMTNKQLKKLVNQRATTKVDKKEKLVAWLTLDDQRKALRALIHDVSKLNDREGKTALEYCTYVAKGIAGVGDTLEKIVDKAEDVVGYVMEDDPS
jgi:hypothetical protein